VTQVIRWEHYPHVAADSYARQWLETQAMLGLAPGTIHAYGRGANDYLAFCQRTSRPVVEATREDVVAYIAEMTQRPNPRGDDAAAADGGAFVVCVLHRRADPVR
jgi:integrase/recombinase XerD